MVPLLLGASLPLLLGVPLPFLLAFLLPLGLGFVFPLPLDYLLPLLFGFIAVAVGSSPPQERFNNKQKPDLDTNVKTERKNK